MKVPLVSLIFLKKSLDFPILLFSYISLHWSLRKAFLSLLAILWHCLSLGLEWKLTFSSPVSCGHCWVFQICWHIECSTFTASSFRIWNSSAGIPSPPLALFVVMLPKAHLTSQSTISGSRWLITPLWLSGSWRSFLYSSVYSCHVFLISFAYVRSIPFLSFIVHIFAWNVPLVSLIFLKRSLVIPILLFSSIFLYFFALITEEGVLLLLLLLLLLLFLSLLAILWNSTFKWIYLSFSPLPLASLLFSAIFKSSSEKHFAFLHFFFLGMVLITASYIISWTSVHSSSGTLSDLVSCIDLSCPLYNCKGFNLSHTWLV